MKNQENEAPFQDSALLLVHDALLHTHYWLCNWRCKHTLNNSKNIGQND